MTQGQTSAPGGNVPGAAVNAAPPMTLPPRVAAEDAVALLRGAGKRFGELRAVHDLNLIVPRGGLIGLIGPSGCGKTTTVRLLLGVYEPSEGEVLVFGTPPHRFSRAERERIGYLPQHFVLYPTLTVEENLNFTAATYGIGPFRRRTYKEQVLELVGVTPQRHTLAGNISGGQQRRLELAATLLHQPELIVLDEPTAGVDPILREQLWAEFRRLQGTGRTLIITTQYVTEAEYCDVVVLMDQGEIVAVGSPEELRHEAAGGDLLDVRIPELDRPLVAQLRALPGVRAVRYLSEDELQLTTENAGALMSQVVNTVQAAGAHAAKVEERRLSFNEIFVTLLERAGHQAEGTRGETH
ncbi:MAG: ABC transporter ATP-binding protein [Thermomicrobiales bacterium]